MAIFTDLEIRILGREERGFPVEITLDGARQFERGYLEPDFLPWTPSATPDEDGQRLFNWLFADPTLKSAWAETRGIHPQRRIRLRIDADAPELHAFPWETLQDTDEETALAVAASSSTPFSRYLAGRWDPGTPVPQRPIKIVVAIADPENLDDYQLAPVDAEAEWQTLVDATADLEAELVRLAGPCTLAALEDAVKDGCHILHFVGHGAFSQRRGESVLYLADDENQVKLVRDHEVAAMLARQLADVDDVFNSNLRLVYLSSCQTATRSPADAFRGLAPQLIAAGVPAVVAMQELVPMTTASAFSATFYRQLLQHGMVDLASNEARAAVLTADLPGAAIPVIFMRLPDGQIFETDQAWLDEFMAGASGTTVALQVGEGGSAAVGKNIVQIGSLKVPMWAIGVVVIGVILGVAAVAFDAVNTRGQLTETQGQLEEIGAVVKATATMTPTPAPTPTPFMAEGQYNIAVAELASLDEAGERVENEEASELSQSIANFLDNQQDALTEIIGEDVVIWGPDRGVTPVEPGSEEERVEAINADALIYGSVRQTDEDRLNVEPKFFLTNDAVGQAEELAGEYALGNSIDYRVDNAASKRDVNTELRERLDAISQLLIGLSYMAFGELEGYRRAAETFQETVDNSDWAQAADGTGQEILYLFLGNAYLSQSFLTEDDDPARAELLARSEDAFSTGVTLNDQYARLHNGLGSTHFQMARALLSEEQCDWDWERLADAEQSFRNAQALPPEAKPASGQVDWRADFGLGRIKFWQGLCQDTGNWEAARDYHQRVINEYGEMQDPIPHLTDITAYAHTDLASMALIEGDGLLLSGDAANEEPGRELLRESIDHYARAVELSALSETEDGAEHVQNFLPFYLTSLCIMDEGVRATAILDEVTQDEPDPEAAREYFASAIDPALWEACDQVETD